ncbi:MAG: DUF4399 domain-containing protein [Porticoccaceae bacterium]|nr:DUF4399 domain-containing protein [Porticoccaceae bacterium]MBT3799507.1 DUF4399 domain-containing protein [Porticoccaceae bacterium]MBT4165181.1 DUF4399 domain-containing protein [Porticoccaceae bacterium]MBT4211424.1 DUF4399 domain-containing protein [Porticoccaceae bacterium]MBT4592008.1 DUF4399 domain-containing protein [Porticoccaceae bacterium]|tara:strand:- start:100 stop:561 length:462 start_codon:yes stop_codon:yes gene_type:complete
MLSRLIGLRRLTVILLVTGLMFMVTAHAQMPVSAAPVDARVYFIEPENGQVFSFQDGKGIEIKFGLSGMEVSPAGMEAPNSGHHHLLINMDQLPDLNLPLPATDQVRHFGKGQTSTKVSLPPGKHRLQLLLGNHVHIPHSPAVMSEIIEIEVK